MADPLFDKEGKITNLDELSVEEVATAYQEKNAALFGRMTEAEKRKAQVKADNAKTLADLEEEKKKNLPPKVEPQTQSQPDISDELRLLAKGLSEEEIDEAKAIAKGKDISLVEALKTKTFLLFQQDLKEERAREKAKLGASNGSEQQGSEITIKPDMTKEDHKKVWKEAVGS